MTDYLRNILKDNYNITSLFVKINVNFRKPIAFICFDKQDDAEKALNQIRILKEANAFVF